MEMWALGTPSKVESKSHLVLVIKECGQVLDFHRKVLLLRFFANNITWTFGLEYKAYFDIVSW